MGTAKNLRTFLSSNVNVCLVTLETVRGSSPRNSDAWMLVSERATHGTIGGGQLEFMAIEEARSLVAQRQASKSLDIPLGPEIGQCCGGRVSVRLSILDDAGKLELVTRDDIAHEAYPGVYIFGAGHVGRALAKALLLLPVRTILVDTRKDELALADYAVETCLTSIPEDVVRNAAPGAAFVVLTHDHSLDFLITGEALARGDASYVGLIGSATKRTLFERWYRQSDAKPANLEKLTCPIGANRSPDKRPEVIAAFAAAEILARLTAIEPSEAKTAAGQEGEIHDN